MPFTFSHPAIILPLNNLSKKWFSLTGLVVGSLIPDFEYFLRMKISSIYSHTFDGLFWFDLPLGILITFIFHNLVRDSLFDNLPNFLKSRFSVFKQFNWWSYFKKNWLIVLTSILIGAGSHMLWDSFTHEQGYFVKTIPTLTSTVTLFSKEILILKILQHSSTIIGGVIISYYVYRLPTRDTKNENMNFKYWIILAGLSLIILTTRFLNGLDARQYGNVIVTSISAVLISLIFTPIFIKNKD